ncbi:hypothetical protein JYU34_012988 [Plutella xylostella]|uniref:Uncharacterized protein n=1 Tax=Plutella xylostella TaxID=51655 RepID=A0ABQ7QCM2_PLUXY|nr:hypothetical protein JYU34_012988 [Plutella xylostella]
MTSPFPPQVGFPNLGILRHVTRPHNIELGPTCLNKSRRHPTATPAQGAGAAAAQPPCPPCISYFRTDQQLKRNQNHWKRRKPGKISSETSLVFIR